MYVKPVPGRIVPDPEMGGYLLPEGREVAKTQYWMRRVRDGDVVVISPPPAAPAPAPAPTPVPEPAPAPAPAGTTTTTDAPATGSTSTNPEA